MEFKKVGVIELGYVGLTLSLALAQRGYSIKGSEANPNVRRIKEKEEEFGLI